MQDVESDRMSEPVARLVEQLERAVRLRCVSSDESWTDSMLQRSCPCASDERPARQSVWRFVGGRRGHSPSFYKAVLILIGHLIGSFLIFVSLLIMTWGLELIFTWLNTLHPFSDEELQVISKLKISMLYFDATMCAAASWPAARTFLKETFQ